MNLYPVMLNIDGKRVVVIGGGEVASRKVVDLLSCGAVVTVIAPEIDESIAALPFTRPGSIELLRRTYRKGDLDGAYMVFSATNDTAVNRDVFIEATEKNIFINAVDDPRNCSFYVPSWFNRNGLVVSVSTSGVSPSLAAKLRREIEKVIPDSIETTLDALRQSRTLLQDDDDFKDLPSEARGRILTRIVKNDDLLMGLVESFKNDAVKVFIKKISEDNT
jgi:precorrin-2 dehydrogenase / sirohydrochlorin ferrochelatase